MPKPSMNGSGDAYQSWNTDQAMAAAVMTRAATPPGLRPPTSASATRCPRSTGLPPTVAVVFSVMESCARAGLQTSRGTVAGAPCGFRQSGRSLQPALLLVVLLGARMQRRGEAVLDHL